MKINEAVMAFSQSEKIKAGLLWTCQSLGFLPGLPGEQRKGAGMTIHAILSMISHEISLARTLTRHEAWDEVGPYIEKALVMIDSGVGHEAGEPLSRALSKVTNIGQQSMSLLKEKQIL